MTAFADNVRASAGALKGNTGLRRLSLTAAIAELSAPVYYTAALVWRSVPAEPCWPRSSASSRCSRRPPWRRSSRSSPTAAGRSASSPSRSRRAASCCSCSQRASHSGSTWLVLVAAAAASICARTLYPALAALIPSLARSREELVAANALVSGIENVGLVAGPALAGVALVVVSPAAVCAAAALGALAAGAAALRLEATGATVGPNGAAEDKTSVAGELVAGFATILADARTRGVVAVHAVHCLGLGALAVVVVQLAIDDLRLGSSGFGLLEAAIALGGVAGGVVAVGRLTGHDTVACIRGGALLWGASLAAVAVASVPPPHCSGSRRSASATSSSTWSPTRTYRRRPPRPSSPGRSRRCRASPSPRWGSGTSPQASRSPRSGRARRSCCWRSGSLLWPLSCSVRVRPRSGARPSPQPRSTRARERRNGDAEDHSPQALAHVGAEADHRTGEGRLSRPSPVVRRATRGRLAAGSRLLASTSQP